MRLYSWLFRVIVGSSVAGAIFVAVSGGHAGTAGAASPQAFAESFAAAIDSKDPDRIKALIDRRSLACLSAEMNDLLSYTISNWTSHAISPRYEATFEDIGPDATLLMDAFFPGRFEYPFRPTRKVQIQTDNTGSHIDFVIAEIGLDGDAWKIVLGCPKPGTAAWMKQQREEGKAKAAEQAKAVDTLVADLEPAYRDELAAIAKGGRLIDAIHKLQADKQVELTIAVMAMKVVAPGE